MKPARACYLYATCNEIGNTRKHQNWLISWSGRRDSNPRPQPWQGKSQAFLALYVLLSFPDFRRSLNTRVLAVIGRYCEFRTFRVGIEWGG